MKIKYYVEGTKGEVLVRTSANEYKYALVNIDEINEGKKSVYCCSGSYENIMKQYNYWKDALVKNIEWFKNGTNKYANEKDATRYENELKGLKIVELIRKEVK